MNLSKLKKRIEWAEVRLVVIGLGYVLLTGATFFGATPRTFADIV